MTLWVSLVILILSHLSYGNLKWRGQILDDTFGKASTLTIEILETGDVIEATLGEPFSLLLPIDTSWTICVTGSGVENCYDLKYLGSDSVFQSNLVGKDYVWKSKSISTTADSIKGEVEEDSTFILEQEQETYSEEKSVQLRKVTLRVRRVPKRALGKSTVTAKMIKRMPGLAEADVIRSIQGLPGVVASSDFSTKIYVRGGGADQNLFLLDNGVVYSPVHFFGLFSTFLVEGIDDVNFYKGGFDPKYGNRLSSVVDIKSRAGGDKDTLEWFSKSSVKISTFTSQVHTEGHQSDFRWLVAGRITYINQILKALRAANVTDLKMDYRFYDLQGNLNYTGLKDKTIDFTFYAGKDSLNFDPITIAWGNQVYPLNFHHQISKNWEQHITASYSKFEQSFALGRIFSFENDIDVWNYKHIFEYKGFRKSNWTLGTQIKKFDIGFTNQQDTIVFNDPTQFWLNSLFIQDHIQGRVLDITIGSRINYSSTVNTIDWEPRLGLNFFLAEDQYLDVHLGYYIQYINSILFNDQETINEFYYPAKKLKIHNVKPTNSKLLSIGYRNERLSENWDFAVESYYKTQNNLLVFAQTEVPDSIIINESSNLKIGDFFKTGEGYSFGLELSAHFDYHFFFGGGSYSLGQSVVLEQRDSLAYFPDWHQPQSWKLDLAVNWKGKDGIWKHKKKGRYFKSSMLMKLASGLPYTESIGFLKPHLMGQNRSGKRRGPSPEFPGFSTPLGNRNSSFVPKYFRWDIKLFDIGREGRWAFSWTILNITNHKNIFLFFYDKQTNPPTQEEITQFPLFPMLLNYEYYF